MVVLLVSLFVVFVAALLLGEGEKNGRELPKVPDLGKSFCDAIFVIKLHYQD